MKLHPWHRAVLQALLKAPTLPIEDPEHLRDLLPPEGRSWALPSMLAYLQRAGLTTQLAKGGWTLAPELAWRLEARRRLAALHLQEQPLTRSPTMPLLNVHAAATTSPDFALSLHDPAEDTPEPNPTPTPTSPVKAVLASTRANWPLVLFHLLILAGAIGYAATATAQPVEALGVSPETLQAVAGDPWATVVVALLFVGGQLVAAWRDWSKVRGTDLEKARERIELLEQDALEKAKEIAKLEAKAELAMLREGDARAAVSGVVGRPEAG